MTPTTLPPPPPPRWAVYRTTDPHRRARISRLFDRREQAEAFAAEQPRDWRLEIAEVRA